MPRQILLADDSATIARMVQITFAHEDYAVTTVKTGDEALARARAARPDVVLVDAGLAGQGGRSGYDLCADLRAGGLRDVPILLLTNNFVPYDDARGQRAGADGFVVKPFETQALIDRVAQVLSGQRPAAAAAAPVQTSRPPMTPAAVVPVAAAVRPSPVISGPAAPTVQMAAPVLPTPASPPRAPVAAPPPAVPVAPIQPIAPVTPVATRQPIATPTTPQPVARPAVPPVQIQPPLAADAGPKPRATILGLPTVGENGLPVVAPVQPIQPVQVAPVQPVRPVQPVVAPAPIAPPPVVVAPERQAPTREMAAPIVPPQPAAPAVPVPVRNEPSRSIRAEAPTGTQPRIEAARSAKANDYAVETATFPGPVGRPGEATAAAPAARKATIPTNAPRMPRPSLVPNAPSAETLRQIVKSVVSAADARMGQALGSHPEYEAVARLSREVIEQIAWEVVPELAEVLIKENMDRLVRERARG